MIQAATAGVDATRELAAAVSELCRAGDVVLLSGDLGAGKTAFAQGFARGLGVREQVTSPTFTLARRYEGRLGLNHLDVYRLDSLQEALDLGLAELVDEGAVTVIEWGDVVIPALAADYLEIRLSFGPTDSDRAFFLQPVGQAWQHRAIALEKALAPWVA